MSSERQSGELCRSYLIVPAGPGGVALERLEQALAAARPACVLFTGVLRSRLSAPALQPLIAVVQDKGIPALVEGDADLARLAGADGVHLDPRAGLPLTAYREARRLLGPDASIGINPGPLRHDAMEVAEAGADYIAFGPLAPEEEAGQTETRRDRISWWAEIFTVPCVAWGVSRSDEAQRLSDLGADFVAIEPAVWVDAVDPVQALEPIAAALSGKVVVR